MKKQAFQLFIAILVCLSAGAIGSLFTMEAIPNWYATLEKPAFTPPNWVFGPVWTMLYILMGIALFLIWRIESPRSEVRRAVIFFGFHLVINASWSIVFFGFQNPTAAFFVILFLIITLLMSMNDFWKLDKKAAFLLTPYLFWVCYATALNFSIMRLNPGL